MALDPRLQAAQDAGAIGEVALAEAAGLTVAKARRVQAAAVAKPDSLERHTYEVGGDHGSMVDHSPGMESQVA